MVLAKRFAAVLVATGLGGALVAPPATAPVHPRVVTYALQDPFLVQLKGGHVAAVAVALVISDDEIHQNESDAGFMGLEATPETSAPPRDIAIRSVVVDILAGATRRQVLARPERERLERRLRRALRDQVGISARSVLFTDVAVK